MNQIKVKKTLLLDILKKNLEKHVKIYKEAVEAYKEKAAEALRCRADEIQEGKTLSIRFSNLPIPDSHEKDYKMVIGMLEMSYEELVEIQSHEYELYVLDEWGWKREFIGKTDVYLERKC